MYQINLLLPLLFSLLLAQGNAFRLPILPFALLHHSQSEALPAQESLHLQKLKSKYPPFTFPQLSAHFSLHPPDGFNRTFPQRYWIDTSYYQPGGPVIVLDAGETDGEERLPFLETGILKYLAEATGGVAIILEHRYYGKSHLTANLSTHSLSLLTTVEALADTSYFATAFPYLSHPELLSSVSSNQTPWIHYGGSYAGAKSAFMRLLYPNQIWGSIASSGVVWAAESFWQYSEPIRLHGEPKCIEAIQGVVSALDNAIEAAGVDENGNQIKSQEVIELMSVFGLEDLKSVRDWMLVVALPIYLWQGKNWDMNLEFTHDWGLFCLNLTSSSPQKTSRFQVPLLAEANDAISSSRKREGPKKNRHANLANYANYIKEYVVKGWCTSNGVSVQYCFDTSNRTFYQDIRLGQVSRLGTYQVCLEWGYFPTAPPADHPTLISRFLDLPYFSKVCQLAYGFPPSHHPNTTAINQYGNFSISPSRLLYVDGDQDPWLYATVHSPYAKEYRGGPGEEDGILIPEAWHHSDENGLGNTTKEPPRIRKVHEKGIEVVKGWIAEWHEERRKKEESGV